MISYVWVFVCVHAFLQGACGATEASRACPISLEMELQTGMSCCFECWQLNLGPVDEQPVFLNPRAISSPLTK